MFKVRSLVLLSSPFSLRFRRNDPNDWECLQLFGDWYANQQEEIASGLAKFSLVSVHPIYNISFYSYYNLRAISAIHQEYSNCPRLQMFKATLQTQHQSLTAACFTIHQVIDEFLVRILKSFSDESMIIRQELAVYLSSSRSPSRLLPLLKERRVLSLFYYEYLPMMINNEMICFLIDHGLSSQNVKEVLFIFDEVKAVVKERGTVDSSL
jgi:hypothetical protein